MSSMTSYPFASSAQSGLCGSYSRSYLTSPAPGSAVTGQRQAFGIQDLLGLNTNAQAQAFSPTPFLTQDTGNIGGYGYQGYSASCAAAAAPPPPPPPPPPATMSHVVPPEHSDFHTMYNPSSWHRVPTLSGYSSRPEDSFRLYGQSSCINQHADVMGSQEKSSGYTACQTPSGKCAVIRLSPRIQFYIAIANT